MKFFYAINLTNRILNRIYSYCMSGGFAAWGNYSKIGRYAKLVNPRLVQVGSNVQLSEYIWLNAKDDRRDGKPTLTIGDHTYIGRFVHINAWRNVVIGNNVLVADRVFISDAEHNYSNINCPISEQGDAFVGGVILCDGCWIGIGAVILPGVKIGRNSIVAANSVVKSDVPDFVIVSGIPAKIVKNIKEKEC